MMLKKVGLLTILIMAISLIVITYVYADDTIQLIIDRRTIPCDVPPIMENDRILVPLRTVSENLNAQVTWNEADSSINIIKDDIHIWLEVNCNVVSVNDKIFEIDAVPTIINGRTMVPVRLIAENLGAEVVWDYRDNIVFVISANEKQRRHLNNEKTLEQLNNIVPQNEVVILKDLYEVKHKTGVKIEVDLSERLDLTTYCYECGAIGDLNIYAPSGEMYAASVDLEPDHPYHIRNASPGKWTFEILSVTDDDSYPSSAAFIITATAPFIDLGIPEATNKRIYDIEGALGDTQVLELNINGIKKSIKSQNGMFKDSIELDDGINKITVVNTWGITKSVSKEYEVTLDTQAPKIVALRYQGAISTPVTSDKMTIPNEMINIGVTTQTDVKTVIMNDVAADFIGGPCGSMDFIKEDDMQFLSKEIMLKPGLNKIEIKIIDKAGNITTKTLEITRSVK